MNPVPPSKTFTKAAREVETKYEIEDERAFDRGENDEALIFTASERMLTDSLPPTMPYVRAKGAGHNVFGTDPELVNKTIDDVLKDATGS